MANSKGKIATVLLIVILLILAVGAVWYFYSSKIFNREISENQDIENKNEQDANKTGQSERYITDCQSACNRSCGANADCVTECYANCRGATGF